MPNIDITVKNKIASGVQGQFVVCGNSDFIIKFSFDSEWDSYNAKTARFIWAEGFEDVNFTGSDCPMPVIVNTNNVVIGVYAGQQLHTTTPAVVMAKRSILCGNTPEGGTIITKGAKGDKGDKGDPGDPGTTKVTTTITSTGTIEPDSVINATSTKTYAELKAAYDNGDMCFAKWYSWEFVCTFANSLAMLFEGILEFQTGETDLPAGKYDIRIGVYANGSCQITISTIKESFFSCDLDTDLSDVEAAYAAGKYIVFVDDHMSGTANHFMPLHYATSSWFVFGCTASLDNNNVYRTLNRSTGVWNEEVSVEMATKSSLDSHTNNSVVHVSNNDKQTWNAKLSDAPSDGKEYARKNGAWSEVQGGGADSIYIVHLVMTSATTIGYASGYSYADMRAKISDGKTILFYIDGLGINSLATQYDTNWVKCVFMNDVSANTPTVYYLVCYSDHFEFRATEVAKKNALSNYATTSALTEGLSGKANVSHTHSASDVSYDSSTTYASGTVGKEISDIDGDVTTLSGTVSSLSTDKQDKSISLSGISATTVEGALSELNSDKVNYSDVNTTVTAQNKIATMSDIATEIGNVLSASFPVGGGE